MPAVPALNHSGAKGVTLSESRLPLSVASKSEHEVILDITNRYEITQARRSGEFIVVDMTVLGRSKREVNSPSSRLTNGNNSLAPRALIQVDCFKRPMASSGM